MSLTKSFRSLTRKQILIILATVFLLIVIPITIYLVYQQQTLKSRATESTTLDFMDNAGNIITQTTNPNVKLRIRKQESGGTGSTPP